MNWSLLDVVDIVGYGAALGLCVLPFVSELVRVMLLDIIRHPLRKTRIEIQDNKHITVKST